MIKFFSGTSKGTFVVILSASADFLLCISPVVNISGFKLKFGFKFPLFHINYPHNYYKLVCKQKNLKIKANPWGKLNDRFFIIKQIKKPRLCTMLL